MLFNHNQVTGEKAFVPVMAPDIIRFVARFIAILLMHW